MRLLHSTDAGTWLQAFETGMENASCACFECQKLLASPVSLSHRLLSGSVLLSERLTWPLCCLIEAGFLSRRLHYLLFPCFAVLLCAQSSRKKRRLGYVLIWKNKSSDFKT